MSDMSTEIVGKIIEGYKVTRPLGQGKFSTVYHAERLKDSKMVALKIIKIFDMMDNKQREKCLQEVKLLQSVDHPGIIKYLDSFIFNNELYIAIEWADKGDLKRFLKKCTMEGEKIDEIKIIEYTRQLASALMHMHEKRIIHRDLKPANILIFGDGCLKLGDLGLGRYMSDETFKAFSKVGTPLYMSPEVIRNDGYDFKSDVWSLGCVIYEIITFKNPFRTDEKISLIELFTIINKGDYPKVYDEKYKSDLRDLVEKMLLVNPDERVSLEDVIKICDNILSNVEEKPKIDPFIVMEDIVEKLRLISYEINFCKKYKKEQINRFYFACNLNKKTDNATNVQYIYYLELSGWLISLIKQNINLDNLHDYDTKFRRYDKKRTNEAQLNDLLSDLKYLDIKIIENVKISNMLNGYGEGVCLIITQLLDKYLVNQNFIFKKPKIEVFRNNKDNEEDFEEAEICEEFTNGMISDKPILPKKKSSSQTNGNGKLDSENHIATKNGNISLNPITKDKAKLPASLIKKSSDEFAKFNSHINVMEPNVDEADWREECSKVERFLENPEYAEFLKSDKTFSYGKNDIFDPKARISMLGGLNEFFIKVHEQPSFSNLNNLISEIDNSLKNIFIFEKKISQNCNSTLQKLINTNLQIKDKSEKVALLSDNIDKNQEKYSVIEEKSESIKIQYDQKMSQVDLKSQINLIKDTMKMLKQETTQMEIKNSLYHQNLFTTYQQNHINKSGCNYHDYEDYFDEYL